MDKKGFHRYLTEREQPIPEGEVIENTMMVERFEEFLDKFRKTLETASGKQNSVNSQKS